MYPDHSGDVGEPQVMSSSVDPALVPVDLFGAIWCAPIAYSHTLAYAYQ